jgi:hypothetical protein
MTRSTSWLNPSYHPQGRLSIFDFHIRFSTADGLSVVCALRKRVGAVCEGHRDIPVADFGVPVGDMFFAGIVIALP